MKIKAKKQSIVSMKLIVPIDGLITVDGNGIADVSPKCATLLVKNTDDWEFLKKEQGKSESKTVKEEAVEEESETTANESSETEEEETEKNEREIFVEKVNSAKVNELRDMCKEAGFPEEEWKSLTKNLLIKYLTEKFDEAEKDDEEEE